MHQSAMFYGRRFFEAYCQSELSSGCTLVEIGSQNVNGSLREACPANVNYIGLDFVDGDGVDIIITDPYKLPIEDSSADVVVSSSCFEHSEFFWLVFLEAVRILKPGGVFYLNAPSNGFFHRWPVDCWRFYPDSGHALVNWANRNGHDMMLLESFIGQRSEGRVSQGGMWNDFVAVFLKGRKYYEKFPNRIVHSLKDFSNGYSSELGTILNHDERGPDFSLIEAQMEQLETQTRECELLRQGVEERDTRILERDTRILELDQMLNETHQVIQHMVSSRSWRLTAPCRTLGTVLKRFIQATCRTDILSRLAAGCLLLPPAIIYYGGLGGFYSALRQKSSLFAKVLNDQHVIRERMLQRGHLIRRLVFLCFSLAIRIHYAGSIMRSLRNFTHIIYSEGMSGLRKRLITTKPMSLAEITAGANIGICTLPPGAERRILVADYRIPRANVSAGERATIGILKDLSALGYNVVFLPKDMAPSPHYEAEVHAYGVKVITSRDGYSHPAEYVSAHGAEFGVFYLIRFDVADTILHVIRHVAPAARVIFHAPDLYFLRERREAELQQDKAALARALQTRDRELAIMRKVDHVVVVSTAEVPVLQTELPGAAISVFPVLYAPVHPAPRGFSERRNIFFLGGFSHKPNINAVHWFATEVWPLVRTALPHAEFHIIGADMPDSVISIGQQPGIKVIGFVPDLDPVLETQRIGVAPLLYGAGIKGKVAMTMGAGIPCVCTDIAAEGMGIENGVQALVANNPRSFAEAVIKLYNDASLWTWLSQNGQALVRDRFGDAANRAALLKVLDNAHALPLALFCDYCKDLNPESIPALKATEQVDVSIIVPVYNNWHLTRACLTSIIQTSAGSGITYEVILADDGSSDETVRAVEYFAGLRVIKTPTNVGFLRNCNNAATYARGRYILLLNNDTIVLPGWLESLYQTLEDDPSIAIAGSKLLYPDGIIQEAGAALFCDGTAINIGRGNPRDTAVFNLVREVDYISGASILIRTSFWQSIGGFDERYKNAYCEDSDLAMTARANGMRVVYQPASEVIHFEHQSYAEQAPSHNTALQNHNIALLLEKWQDTFQRDHMPPCEWQLAASLAERSVPAAAMARRQTKKLNILYFSPFPSHPASHGNRATIKQFARRFQELGHKVHFVLLQSADYDEPDLADMSAAWDSLEVIPFSNPMVANGQEIPFDGWYENGIGERIRILCAKYEIDIVFCSYIFQSKLLEFVPPYILKVIDTHDKMGDRYEMLRKNGQPLEFFSCTPAEEGAYLRRADVVVARRQEEANYFDSVTGHSTAIVIPHVENTNYLNKENKELKHVGIVASANRINLAIVQECLESIDKCLGQSNAPFTVHIAGQVKEMVSTLPPAKATVFKKPWVNLRGFVPEIADFYREMDIVVSPVTMGTGINVKTVQAMAFGMPLLTTTWGIKGIETNEPMHNHSDLKSLAVNLLNIVETPSELARLAAVSRQRYETFYQDSLQAMNEIFVHPKLFQGRQVNLQLQSMDNRVARNDTILQSV